MACPHLRPSELFAPRVRSQSRRANRRLQCNDALRYLRSDADSRSRSPHHQMPPHDISDKFSYSQILSLFVPVGQSPLWNRSQGSFPSVTRGRRCRRVRTSGLAMRSARALRMPLRSGGDGTGRLIGATRARCLRG